MSQVMNWTFTLNNYTPEDVLAMQNCPHKYLVFGYEVGEKGTPHLQGYIELMKKQRLSYLKKVHSTAHWEIRRGTAKQASDYCKKDGNFYEDGILSEERMKAGVSTNTQEQRRKIALKVLSSQSKEDAFELVREEMPYEMLLHGESIKRNLNLLFPTIHEHKFGILDFECPPLFEQVDPTKISILIWGKSGFGKTQYALANFKNPLLVRHMDKLKELTPSNDAIIFDDLSFQHYPPEAVIHLLDVEEDSDIHVRYAIATIPKNLPRIFTHNTKNPFYKSAIIDAEQQKAIDRRVYVMECVQVLYKK